MRLFLSTLLLVFAGFSNSCGIFGGGGTDEKSSSGPGSQTVEGGVESGATGEDKSEASETAKPGAETVTVRFDKGATSKDYDNSVTPGGKHTYVLGATKGQLMKVRISSKDSNAMFTVLDPVGNKLTDGEGGNSIFEKILPSSGNYKILVSTAQGDAKYKVGFSVTGGTNADGSGNPPISPGGITTVVKFAKGKSSASYENAVIRGDRDSYVLGANAGQTMTVNITSVEDNAVFQIEGPKGFLPGAEPGTDTRRWSGKLPAKGNYSVIVGGTRGNATYKISFAIR